MRFFFAVLAGIGSRDPAGLPELGGLGGWGGAGWLGGLGELALTGCVEAVGLGFPALCGCGPRLWAAGCGAAASLTGGLEHMPRGGLDAPHGKLPLPTPSLPLPPPSSFKHK